MLVLFQNYVISVMLGPDTVAAWGTILDKLTHRHLSFLVNDMFIVYIYKCQTCPFSIYTAVLIGIGWNMR